MQTQSISPEQALGLFTDAEQVYAEVFGLTRVQYVEWHASQGASIVVRLPEQATVAETS